MKNINNNEIALNDLSKILNENHNKKEILNAFLEHKRNLEFQEMVNIPALKELVNAINGLNLFEIYQEAKNKPLNYRIAYENTPLKFREITTRTHGGKEIKRTILDTPIKVLKEYQTGQKRNNTQIKKEYLTLKNYILYKSLKGKSKTARISKRNFITEIEQKQLRNEKLKNNLISYYSKLGHTQTKREKNTLMQNIRRNITLLNKINYKQYKINNTGFKI